jgi:hypothetical protein
MIFWGKFYNIFINYMLIKKADAFKKELWPTCTIREYKWDSDILSSARSIINWRLPEKWVFVNKECEEVYFVMSGKWKVFSNKGLFEINEWDVYHFDKWEKYYVEWENLSIFISNSPKWRPEQFEIIE